MQADKVYPIRGFEINKDPDAEYNPEELTIIVLGVGGTGSELIPKLARLASGINSKYRSTFNISLIACDGDLVEHKNLERQNFMTGDLGKNKAETLIRKCNGAFGLSFGFVPSYIESAKDLENIIIESCTSRSSSVLIIGCTDSVPTRVMLSKFVEDYDGQGYMEPYRVLYIDSGNEEFGGQVVLGIEYSDSDDTSWAVYSPNSNQVVYDLDLPTVCYHYPEMLTTEEKFASDISCAERAFSNPQAMDANVEAATIIFQMVNNLLRGGLCYHKVVFDVLTGNRKVYFNTKPLLYEYGVLNPDDSQLTDSEISAESAYKSSVTNLEITELLPIVDETPPLVYDTPLLVPLQEANAQPDPQEADVLDMPLDTPPVRPIDVAIDEIEWDD